MRVSKRYRMLFYCGTISRSDTWKKRFTTMTPLGMSRDVKCHRLWRHNCFSNSIKFELIYFTSIWTSQNLLKIRTFLCIRKRNELFDHPSYIHIKTTKTSNQVWTKVNKCVYLSNHYNLCATINHWQWHSTKKHSISILMKNTDCSLERPGGG